MKALVVLATIIIQIKFNCGFYDRFVLDRFGLKEFKLDLSNVDIYKNNTCPKGKRCIWKCCPEGQIIGRFKECITFNKASYKSVSSFDNVTVYNDLYVPTNKSLKSVFKVVPGLMKNDIFAKNSLWWYKAYLLENGKLFFKFPNVWYRWKSIDTNHFCVDLKKNDTTIAPVFMAEYEIEHFRIPSTFKKWALIVSILFLMLILAVYFIVPELRNLNGIILMVFIICLIMSQIMHCCLESYNAMKLWMSEILSLIFTYYFFKLASYCWTNAMFYRLLTSSDTMKDAPSLYKKQLLKYSPYAFGLPLLMTIATATVELTDMTDMPSFVTPQIQNRGNFSFHEIESLYYLYIPLMMILAFNWIVCFLKLVEFCKNSRRFAVVSSNDAKETPFNSPMQFVKVLIIMNVYALLEMLTVIYPSDTHYTTATYTLCIGPLLLVVFVSSVKVRTLLLEKIIAYKTKATSNNLFGDIIFIKNN